MVAEPHVRVVIAGGGTGGHLYPGIAVAREWLSRQPDAEISFVGTARGIESRLMTLRGLWDFHQARLKKSRGAACSSCIKRASLPRFENTT